MNKSTIGDLLPAPKLGFPQTLEVIYNDDRVARVPYFDKNAAETFLSIVEHNIKSFKVTPYTG